MKLLIVTFVFSPCLVFAQSPFKTLEVIEKNNQALEALQKKQLGQAFESVVQGLAEAPRQVVLLFNLGLIYELQKTSDKALKIYEQILNEVRISPELRFFSAFNIARIHGEGKNVDLALDYYQRALGFKPGSVEVKTNIELLLKDQKNQGKGDSKDKKDDKKDQEKSEQNKDKQNKDKPKDEDQNKKDQQKQSKEKSPQKSKQEKKKPFKSKELTENDVRKILEELKQQEKKIREKINQGKAKDETPNVKDW